MTAVIDGATIGVHADLGPDRAPFVLNRDELDSPGSTLGEGWAALADLTASVIAVDAQWGATDWQGSLTLAEAGGCTFDLWDPNRWFDPANPNLSDPPSPGRVVQLSVDGVVFQTTYTDSIGHDMAEGITTVSCIDALAIASRVGVNAYLPSGSVLNQLAMLSSISGTPIAVEGALVASRSAELFTGNLLDGLQRLQEAELGQVFANEAGNIVFRNRGGVPDDPNPQLTVGLNPGISVVEMGTELSRRLVNAVYITPLDPGSPVMVFRDQGAIAAAGGEVAAQADAADLLLI